ncbi:unnamed protein product [Tilletia laevis]|uniref:CMP/dCMP-type deaminase domain-containing protein n=2 Tax=Tilletia TaxID=13289 RepID=A0A177VDC1_9BASI|nr:hypothetical protein CF336_g1321 [Tilletia laevis]KAE8264441.1 hypothetical protein A4X03_0g949 [Tilletia caries]KAE8207970.1 hypothetical protein CF335_g756 [Tilletia laevis]CAD6886330.1 unnamed protein product [Tilletia caries]CAD6897497.1 unnamed protein product [Tilletia laevis]
MSTALPPPTAAQVRSQTDPEDEEQQHYKHMLHALQLADKCIPTTTAFCVGCTIYTQSSPSSLLSTGYSRELPGNTHAEQCALDKIVDGLCLSSEKTGEGEGEGKDVVRLDLYTTMEPCSKRASDPQGCAQRIIAFNSSSHVLRSSSLKRLRIERVFQGVREPTDFQLCEGQRLLREAGVEVLTVLPPPGESAGGREWLEGECLRIAKKGHADEAAAPAEDVVRLWKDAVF